MSAILDAKDLKILAEVDAYPRLSTSQLAKKVRLSQQVADYRLKRLFQQGIIINAGAVINYHNLGFQQYRLLFTFFEIPEAKRQDLTRYLSNHNQVYWAATIGGKWDLLVVLITEDYHDLLRFFDDFYGRFKAAIRGHDILRVLYQEFHWHKFLHHNESPQYFFIDSRPKRPFELLQEIDQLDYKIIHALKSNARISHLELGRKFQVSYKTIQNRIKKLERLNIIVGYRLFFKSKELGYQAYQLLLNLDNYMQKDIEALIRYTRYSSSITQFILILGEWDVYLHLRTKTIQEVQATVIDLRNKFSIIKDYQYTPIFEDITIDHLPMSERLAGI